MTKKVNQSVNIGQEHFSKFFNEDGDWRKDKMPKRLNQKQKN